MKKLLVIGVFAACGGSGTEWTTQPLKPLVATMDAEGEGRVKVEIDLPEGVKRVGEERGNAGKTVDQARFRFDTTHGDKTDLTLMVELHQFGPGPEAGRATLDEYLKDYGKRGVVLRKETLPDGYIVTQHDPNNGFATHRVTVLRDIGGTKIHCEAEGTSPAFDKSAAALEAVCLSMRAPKA